MSSAPSRTSRFPYRAVYSRAKPIGKQGVALVKEGQGDQIHQRGHQRSPEHRPVPQTIDTHGQITRKGQDAGVLPDEGGDPLGHEGQQNGRQHGQLTLHVPLELPPQGVVQCLEIVQGEGQNQQSQRNGKPKQKGCELLPGPPENEVD